jgi:hypothetical protein
VEKEMKGDKRGENGVAVVTPVKLLKRKKRRKIGNKSKW